jgi:hypothetical protein
MIHAPTFKALSRERLGFDPGAEGATAPETLRQKDRASIQTLESSGLWPLAEGARDRCLMQARA